MPRLAETGMTLSRWPIAFVVLALAASPALARYRHHRVPVGPVEAQAPPRYWRGWQAEAIARAAAAQRAAPGLTEELAPDAKETATGGPVGGVPGFDGL